MLIYYIYAYINKKTGLPYYIGKGKNNRAWEPHGRVKVPKDKSKIIIIESNLTELGAFALERRLIRWWGRKDLKTGILLNRTDGGEGATNFTCRTGLKAFYKDKKIVWRNKSPGPEWIKGKPSNQKGKRWFNNGIKNIMAFEKPGDDWVEGGLTQIHKSHSISEYICPHCNKIGKGSVMFKHHFNNCKKI